MKKIKSKNKSSTVTLTVISLLLICCFALGAIATLILFRNETPESLSKSEKIKEVSVASQEFNDSKRIELELKTSPEQSLNINSAGIISESSCVIGQGVNSGQSTYEVSGEPILNMFLSKPLWRDIQPADKGSDVKAIQEELVRLGYKQRITETFDSQTITNMNAVFKEIKAAKMTDGVLLQNKIFWLPAPSINPSECAVTKGSNISAGNAVLKISSGFSSAKILVVPENSVSGARNIIVGEGNNKITAPISLDNTITDAAVLSQLAPYAQAPVEKDQPYKLSATWVLSDKLKAYSVPPSAIVTKAGEREGCVITDGQTVKVNILGSQLGQSFISAAQDKNITKVLLKPPAGTVCE